MRIPPRRAPRASPTHWAPARCDDRFIIAEGIPLTLADPLRAAAVHAARDAARRGARVCCKRRPTGAAPAKRTHAPPAGALQDGAERLSAEVAAAGEDSAAELVQDAAALPASPREQLLFLHNCAQQLLPAKWQTAHTLATGAQLAVAAPGDGLLPPASATPALALLLRVLSAAALRALHAIALVCSRLCDDTRMVQAARDHACAVLRKRQAEEMEEKFSGAVPGERG